MVSSVKLLRAFGKYCNGDINTVKKSVECIGKNSKASVYRMVDSDGYTITAGFDNRGNLIKRFVKSPEHNFSFRRYPQTADYYEDVFMHSGEITDFRTGKTSSIDISKAYPRELLEKWNVWEPPKWHKSKIYDAEASVRNGNRIDITQLKSVNPIDKTSEIERKGTIFLDA